MEQAQARSAALNLRRTTRVSDRCRQRSVVNTKKATDYLPTPRQSRWAAVRLDPMVRGPARTRKHRCLKSPISHHCQAALERARAVARTNLRTRSDLANTKRRLDKRPSKLSELWTVRPPSRIGLVCNSRTSMLRMPENAHDARSRRTTQYRSSEVIHGWRGERSETLAAATRE